MFDDVRENFDPDREIPDWFWQVVEDAKDAPDTFDRLSDERLVEFANQMGDMRSYFHHLPFCRDGMMIGENALDECGAWVVSQGRDYLMKVWDSPSIFYKLLDEDGYEEENGPNFEFAANQAWERRHGTEIPKQW